MPPSLIFEIECASGRFESSPAHETSGALAKNMPPCSSPPQRRHGPSIRRSRSSFPKGDISTSRLPISSSSRDTVSPPTFWGCMRLPTCRSSPSPGPSSLRRCSAGATRSGAVLSGSSAGRRQSLQRSGRRTTSWPGPSVRTAAICRRTPSTKSGPGRLPTSATKGSSRWARAPGPSSSMTRRAARRWPSGARPRESCRPRRSALSFWRILMPMRHPHSPLRRRMLRMRHSPNLRRRFESALARCGWAVWTAPTGCVRAPRLGPTSWLHGKGSIWALSPSSTWTSLCRSFLSSASTTESCEA